MPLRLVCATDDDRALFERLLQLCLHDLSEYESAPVDHAGYFGNGQVDQFWHEARYERVLAYMAGRPAGIIVLHKTGRAADRDKWRVEHFFVLRSYRRLGIGDEMARRVFDMYPGEYEVYLNIENRPAIEFWRQVVRRSFGKPARELGTSDESTVVLEFSSFGPAQLDSSAD